MNTEVNYAIGDVDSEARGSGARANGNKPRFDLLPLYQLANIAGYLSTLRIDDARDEIGVAHLLELMGEYQQNRDVEALYQAQATAVAVMLNWQGVTRGPSLVDLGATCRVWEIGVEKYAAWNWSKGMPIWVPLGCAMRHLAMAHEGEWLDPESKQPHLAHFICNVQMMCHYHHFYPDLAADGLPKPEWFSLPDGRSEPVTGETLYQASADKAIEEVSEELSEGTWEETRTICLDVEPSTPAPNWDEAPDDAVAWAVDQGGCSAFYSEIPEQVGSDWIGGAGGFVPGTAQYVELPSDFDWRESLVLRPGTEHKSREPDSCAEDGNNESDQAPVECNFTINWDEVPAEIHYIAVDGDSTVWGYESEVRFSEEMDSWFLVTPGGPIHPVAEYLSEPPGLRLALERSGDLLFPRPELSE